MRPQVTFIYFLLLLSLPTARDASAANSEVCQYVRADGTITLAESLEKVPEQLRDGAKCFASRSSSAGQHQDPARKDSDGEGAARSGGPAAARTTSSRAEVCQFAREDGTIAIAGSRAEIPDRYRPSARCFAVKPAASSLASPDEIELDGTVRRQEISTSLGVIKLRWPRVVERDFGRTPSRAVIEAAHAVSRAVHRPGFPSRVRRMDVEWNVVFLDENLPEQQIPRNLIDNCHPGWMTPPANIYIVGQRAAAGCGGSRVTSSIADARLAEVLVHEMGHAVEWQLLHERGVFDRMRAEGFATWFEGFVASYSSLLNQKHIMHRHVYSAKSSLEREPHLFLFRGDAESYARSSMYFGAFVKRFGIGRLVDVYDLMSEKRMPFFTAVREETGWSGERFNEELARFLEREQP